MNQDMESVKSYPTFVSYKIIGEPRTYFDIPGSHFGIVSYENGLFFREYRKPYTATINLANIVCVQRFTYDTVKFYKKEISNGLIRKWLHLKPKTKWIIDKTGEITVDRIVLATNAVIFVEPQNIYNCGHNERD